MSDYVSKEILFPKLPENLDKELEEYLLRFERVLVDWVMGVVVIGGSLYVNGELISEGEAVSGVWKRVVATLYPCHPGDDVNFGAGSLYGSTKNLTVDDAVDAHTHSNVTSGNPHSVTAADIDAELADIADLALTDGNFIVGDGSSWIVESADTARHSLGLGTADSPTFNIVISTSLQDASSDDVITVAQAKEAYDLRIEEVVSLPTVVVGKTVKLLSDNLLYLGKAY